MRIRASDGKLYDPEKSNVLDKRIKPDGKTESLLRTINGAYYLYTTPEYETKSMSITPLSYDSALEWIDNYSSREKINGIMLFDADNPVNLRFTVQVSTLSLTNNISSITNKSRTEIIETAIKAYAKHLEETKE